MRGIGVRQVRLVCGLILFCYLLSHYINHSLGNVSLDAMEYGLWFHVALWHSVVGTLLLYPALAVHGSLGLWALYQRRHFRWKITEVVQLTLGLSIPALLCTHLIGERLGVTLYGLQRSYAQALYTFWEARPDLGVMQAMLLLVAWIHGCIGIYFWLRLKRFFPKMVPVLLGLAVLLPVLALLGFYQQGRTIELLAQQPEWRAQILAPARIGTAAERDNLIRLRDYFLISYAAAIALVFAAQVVRLLGVKSGMTVADVGAGSGYYVVRLSPIVGRHGRVIAEDVVPEYLRGLRRRVRDLRLQNVAIGLGEPHDPRLPADSLDIAILVHMYHEIAQPYALLYNLVPHSGLALASGLSTHSRQRPSTARRPVSCIVSLQPSGIARSASIGSTAATPILRSSRHHPSRAGRGRKLWSRAKRHKGPLRVIESSSDQVARSGRRLVVTIKSGSWQTRSAA